MSCNDAAINKLFQRFTENQNIKLCFENKEALDSLEPIINISIHPIRFCDDIFLNFETNDTRILSRLRKYQINENNLFAYSDYIRAMMLARKSIVEVTGKTLLLVGQTEFDKAVFDGTKHLNLTNFLDQISELSKIHDNVLFKPHPYSKNTRRVIKSLKNVVPKLTLDNNNIYQLLSNDNISTVAGLNSSVLHEAHYFDKEACFFMSPNFDFTQNDVPIKDHYFNSSFWAEILGTGDINMSLPSGENRLRRLLSGYWAYPEINTHSDLYAYFKYQYIKLKSQFKLFR